ncbi:MAG: hypothetical protein MMC33_003476 [Icmadophila ericetorum]|nr:hypothetical protein [Icmadophila ericetorum]
MPTARAKRKRSQVSEAKAERPAKQPRRSRPPRLEPFEEYLQKDSKAEAKAKAKANDPEPPLLSEESEEDIRTLYKEVMNSVPNNASALKRTSSRRSIVPSETDTV